MSYYNADFRLRSFITAQLEDIAAISQTETIYKRISVANAICQKNLCYRIRFGTHNRKPCDERDSVDLSQRNEIEDAIEKLRNSS